MSTLPVGWARQTLMQFTQGLATGTGMPLPSAPGLPGAPGGPSVGSRLAQLGLDGPGGVPLSPSTGGPSFADTLKQAVGGVSDAQDNAKSNIEAFLRGDPVELHQVMAAQEEAGIALEMLIEVRNKFTEAYRSVINMQS